MVFRSFCCLLKPHDPEDLTRLVFKALASARAERQKEIDDQLLIATRMASGICHHFNNLLEGVIGRTSLLSARSDLPLDLYRELRAILDDGRQMAGLMRRLSYFGQTEMNIRQNLQPLSILREAIKNTAQNHRNRIRLTCEFDESVSLNGDSRRVSEMFTELLANACEAGPLDQLVAITAKLEKGEQKNWLHIAIADEGPGLSQWQKENMFQPFFTTRFPAGRGLGLAVASAIATQLEGSLKVDNRTRCGAVATVTVPVNIGSKIRTEAITEVHPPTYNRSVLVIDDMPGVLEMISRMAGMVFDQQVVSISSGADAIKAAADPNNKFSMVLLDLGLKDMTGTHAYGQIRVHLPDIPILFISGFTSDPEMAKILDKDPNCRFLEKPFDLNQLKVAMRSF